MTFDNLFSDTKEIRTKDEKPLQFIKFFPKSNLLMCWERDRKELSGGFCQGVNIRDIKIEALKEIDIWKTLSDRQKIELEAQHQEHVQSHTKGRRPKNPENALLPKKLHCQACDRDKITNADQLRKMSAKLKISIEDIAKDYICRSCKKKIREKKDAVTKL